MHIVNISVVKFLKALVSLLKREKYLMKLRCCHSLILPYVSYCIHEWGKAYDTHPKYVMVLQNKAVRVISGVPPPTNADNLYLELPVKKIFVYIISIFMYRYMNGMLPELFLDMFNPIIDIRSYIEEQSKGNWNFKRFFYVKFTLSYPYENWQHPVEERVNGAQECV